MFISKLLRRQRYFFSPRAPTPVARTGPRVVSSTPRRPQQAAIGFALPVLFLLNTPVRANREQADDDCRSPRAGTPVGRPWRHSPVQDQRTHRNGHLPGGLSGLSIRSICAAGTLRLRQIDVAQGGGWI